MNSIGYSALMVLALGTAAVAQQPALPVRYTAMFGIEAQIASVAVDSAGNAYIAGTAVGALPVTPGAFQTEYKPGACATRFPSYPLQPVPCPVAFAAKLNHDGTALVYLTYLGASNSAASNIAVDGQGNAWIAGTVTSQDLPLTPGALQSKLKGTQNGFVLKLNPNGSRVLVGTYLGGSSFDTLSALAVDRSGSALVGGYTDSADFPTSSGAFQTDGDQQTTASFLTKFDASGKLVYSTLFHGGKGSGTYLSAVAVDAAGNAYFTGSHAGGSLPTTPAAIQPNPNPRESAFAAKLDATGARLLYSTYLGANSDVIGYGIAVDAQGAAYVAGDIYLNTPGGQPSSFPTTVGAFQTETPPFENQSAPFIGFIAKLNATGSALIYSTFLYGSGSTTISRFAVDPAGAVVAVGDTDASDFPTTPGALRQCNPAANPGRLTGFLLKLAPDGSRPLYSTYLGTGTPLAVGLDGAGDVYLAGDTAGSLPIVPGSFGWTGSGAFVARLTPMPLAAGSVSCVVSAASQGGRSIAPGEIVDIVGNGIGPVQGVSAVASAGRVDTVLGGVQVLFNGVPAPLLAVGLHRIRAVVPFETGPINLDVSGSVSVQILNGLTAIQPFTAPTAALAPSVFTVDGRPVGQALMRNEDGTLNSKQNPALQGSAVTIYATGLNNTQPALATGMIASEAASLTVRLQASDPSFGQAEVLYAGAAPGFVAGLTQINLRLPVSIFHGRSSLAIQGPKGSVFSSQPGVFFYLQ